MLLKNLVGSVVTELLKSQDEKRADLIYKYFGEKPVLNLLLLEQQNKVYTDSFYIYNDVDNIVYTAADYPSKFTMRNIRIYDAEANVIGRVEEMFPSSVNDDLDVPASEQPDARIYSGELLSIDMEKGNRGIYQLNNGWSVKRDSQGKEFTIFSASSAVAEVTHMISYNRLFTDAIYFYAAVDELQILMIALAFESLLMPDKDNKKDTPPDVKSYKEDLKLLTRQRDMRKQLFIMG